ncbi:MAG: response regulator [Rubrivivax sp.]|nr:response regulator [Rubrivivax sp.]MDP3224166.1 response regulator [Rubrivivax sp.]MDP3611802.1 response regulator [Rubrivivax sp.]
METKPYHLFVVEDDPPMRDMLASYLEKQGLAVTTMASAEDLLRRIHRLRPDLVVLDVTLPGLSGLQACQQLRAQGDRVPIILLTARTEEIDRVLGLEMGADDYMGKPFSARELLARIRAVLRRNGGPPGVPIAFDRTVPIGKHQFQAATRSLTGPDGHLRVLSTVEYAMLAELVCNPNVPLSRERLLAVSHTRADALLTRTVDVAVMRLRKLVEPDPAVPRYIQTVRGHGYMFVPARGARAA